MGENIYCCTEGARAATLGLGPTVAGAPVIQDFCRPPTKAFKVLLADATCRSVVCSSLPGGLRMVHVQALINVWIVAVSVDGRTNAVQHDIRCRPASSPSHCPMRCDSFRLHNSPVVK